jgi:hypothetical protein
VPAVFLKDEDGNTIRSISFTRGSEIRMESLQAIAATPARRGGN